MSAAVILFAFIARQP